MKNALGVPLPLHYQAIALGFLAYKRGTVCGHSQSWGAH